MRDVSDELERAAAELDDEYLLCRDIGHSWRLLNYTPLENGMVARRLKCRSCKTVRVDRITRNFGTVYGRTYEYPEGYQLTGFGTQVFQRATYRRIAMDRAGVEE